MARVLALVADLMFGSRLQAAMTAAGHEFELCSQEDQARARGRAADVLVVDLASDAVDGASLVQSMRAAGELGATATLGFYPHVDAHARERAQAAGFDLVVPRSRMAREPAELVARLLDGDR